jgi:hypothetical protein
MKGGRQHVAKENDFFLIPKFHSRIRKEKSNNNNKKNLLIC